MIVYFEADSVADDLGIGLTELYAVSNTADRHYRKVELPKKGGGVRLLHVPDDRLKFIQRRINERILSRITVSPYATAYKYNSSIRKNALPHVGKAMVLKLDIEHFFDSIMYSQVKDKVFPKEYFSESIRILLSMLCYYKDALPQGAPTSPAISNIIMRDFDEEVGHWCKSRGISYTRYCDDMTFSGEFDPTEVTEYVVGRLREMGFFLNKRKTKTVKNSQRQLVTGVVVNEKPSVPSEMRHKLRQELYYCKKFGVAAHMEKHGVPDDTATYIMRLLGRVEYFLNISGGNKEFLEYKSWLTDELKRHR